MRLSSQVGTGSEEQDFAGSVDNSLMISCTDVGSNSVSGSTSLGMMTGAAAAAVDARILATLSTKNLAKSFSDVKDLREIRPGSPPTRAPNAGGVVKIGDFRQITGYIMKTVKDIDS